MTPRVVSTWIDRLEGEIYAKTCVYMKSQITLKILPTYEYALPEINTPPVNKVWATVSVILFSRFGVKSDKTT